MPRLHYRPELKAIRRDLRSRPTAAEDCLWKRLRRRQFHGWKFRRQHSVGSYVLDFYCAEARLGIELDGAVHRDPLRTAYDAKRQAWLEAQGLRVLRFRNEEVLKQLDLVLEAVTLAVMAPLPPAPDFSRASSAAKPPASPPRGGEGEK